MSPQRSFGELKPRRRSPWPGEQVLGHMPQGRAKVRDVCPLCPVDIKSGQRVAKYFDEDAWAHIGCMFRELHRRNAEEVVELGLVPAGSTATN